MYRYIGLPLTKGLKNGMSQRDEFNKKTKSLVALRSNYQCALCGQATAGPSDESSSAVTIIGEAAHIHAAAPGPGARRYLASMSREERSHIDNAIWLCANHARLIDRDQTRFTPDYLREMKRKRENAISTEISGALGKTVQGNLIAIGPDVICIGELLRGEAEAWRISIEHFVEGDFHALLSFIDRFYEVSPLDRYVLVNAIGDGRSLQSSPTWEKTPSGYVVTCAVYPSFPRIRADELGVDIALSEKHEMFTANGDIATVSGLVALPQKLKNTLSMQRGESPFNVNFGTRLAEYYSLIGPTPWFRQLVILETIRQAAIPYGDFLLKTMYTPLQCVERVLGVDLLSDTHQNGWFPINFRLQVKGVGRWEGGLSVHVIPAPRRPSLNELLSGPIS